MPSVRSIAKQALITVAVIFALSQAKKAIPAIGSLVG